MKITIELEANQAAALHRLCARFSHEDALRFLYPHVARGIRMGQAEDAIQACIAVQRALEEIDVRHFPWIDTGEAK